MLDPKEQAKQGFGAFAARQKERHDQQDADRSAPASAMSTPVVEPSSASPIGLASAEPASAEPEIDRAAANHPDAQDRQPAARVDSSR